MSTDWYYTKGGQQLGPVTAAEIEQLAASGALRPDDQVWNNSFTEWTPARQVTGLTFASAEHHTAPEPTDVPTSPIASASSPMAVQLAAAPIAGSFQMLGYESPGSETVTVTPRTVELLQQTRPWVLTISVLMFLGAGLMALGAIVVAIFAVGSSGPSKAMLGIALIYLVAAALTGVPTIFLAKYSARIKTLVRLRRAVDLEHALEAQKSYWKWLTIATLTLVGLYFVAMALMIFRRF